MNNDQWSSARRSSVTLESRSFDELDPDSYRDRHRLSHSVGFSVFLFERELALLAAVKVESLEVSEEWEWTSFNMSTSQLVQVVISKLLKPLYPKHLQLALMD